MKSTNYMCSYLKRMILFSILIVFSWKANSQTATNKDSVVVISKDVARGILKDLNSYDALKKEVVILKHTDSLQAVRLQTKDSVISVYVKQVAAANQLANNFSMQRDVALEQRNIATKNFKIQKRKTILSQVIGLSAVIFLLLFK
jgi:hypothetical protein